jgi:hypothetical protein
MVLYLEINKSYVNRKIVKVMIDKILEYESGDLSFSQVVELFSELVKNGMAWTLQGHYGRTAQALIDAGYLNKKGDILKVDTE